MGFADLARDILTLIKKDGSTVEGEQMGNVNGIDLKEFVEETVRQVMNGVRNVTEEVMVASSEGSLVSGINVRGRDTSIDFDIALTVSQDAKGGGGFKIAVFGLEGTVTAATEFVHRIKISVPVTFPYTIGEYKDGGSS